MATMTDIKPEWMNALKALEDQSKSKGFSDIPEWNNAMKALEQIKSTDSPSKKGKKNKKAKGEQKDDCKTPQEEVKHAPIELTASNQLNHSQPSDVHGPPAPPPPPQFDHGPHPPQGPYAGFGFPPIGMGYGPQNIYQQYGYPFNYGGYMGGGPYGVPPPPWMNSYGPGPGNFGGSPRGPMGPHQGPYGGPGMGPPLDHSSFRGPPSQRFPFGDGPRGPPPDMNHGRDSPSESGLSDFPGQSPHFNNRNNKQSPGAGGIRFQLQKRKNLNSNNSAVDNPLRTPPNKFMRSNAPLNSIQNSSDNMAQKNTAITGQHDNRNDSHSGGTEDPAGEWPQSLKDYVQRAFAAVVNESQKDQVENILKDKLTKIFNSPGGANLVNWESEPLPTEQINLGSGDSQNNLPPAFGLGAHGIRFPQRGRGNLGIRQVGTPQRPLYSRDRVPTYRRSRSRSFSSSSRSWSRSRSRSRSRTVSPERRRRKFQRSSNSRSPSTESSRSSPIRSKFGRNRGRGLKTPRGRDRGNTISSRMEGKTLSLSTNKKN